MKVLIGFCLLAVAFAARPEVKKTCTEKPETGVCMALFRMWYYDPETESCKKFIYGGCQGNGNRYSSEEECLANCKDGKAALEQLSVQQDVNCNSLPEAGVCDAYMPRFYYDPLEARCKKFIYGGCGGNGNNFRTEEECNTKCADSGLELAIPFPFSCDCESSNSSCSCCGHLNIQSIKLDHKACAEVSYNTDKKALKVEIKMNKKVVFSKTLSARNPPPVCVPITMFVDVCFDFYDIKANRQEIHFCLNVKPRLIRKEVTDFKVGCFNFGRNSNETQQSGSEVEMDY